MGLGYIFADSALSQDSNRHTGRVNPLDVPSCGAASLLCKWSFLCKARSTLIAQPYTNSCIKRQGARRDSGRGILISALI